MGLFSKFLGKELGAEQAKKLDEAGAQILGKLFSGEAPARPQEAARSAPEAPARQQTYAASSPYDAVPAEENSFNFGGPYQAYFRKVFAEEFPGWQISESEAPHGRGTLFTFSQGGGPALVVEVMSEGCSAQKVRRECERAGTPYLRYYYDHRGWWNTRSYVTERTRKALGI